MALRCELCSNDFYAFIEGSTDHFPLCKACYEDAMTQEASAVVRVRGTPRTLEQAVQNGLDATAHEAYHPDEIVNHVRDYLSQCFQAAELNNESKLDLWARIIKKEPK